MDFVTASETFVEIPALGQSHGLLPACYLFQLHRVFGVRRMINFFSPLTPIFEHMAHLSDS